jgi:hypothetical protein
MRVATKTPNRSATRPPTITHDAPLPVSQAVPRTLFDALGEFAAKVAAPVAAAMRAKERLPVAYSADADATRAYDLSAAILSLSTLLSRRIDRLSHIDANRIICGISVQRGRSRSGTFAACHALRFDDGERTLTRRGRTWEWPVVRVGDTEMLYYLSFTIPRFLALAPRGKLETIVHELFHISPKFDGSLRVLGTGRHAHHGPSRAYYDKLIAPIVVEAEGIVTAGEYPFLALDYRKLKRRYGSVTGTVAKRLRPRLVQE